MKNIHKNWRLSLLLGLVFCGLSACGGSDNSSDNVGGTVPPDGKPASEIKELQLSITDITTINNQTQVTVLATNEHDEYVAGLQGMSLNQYLLYPQGFTSSGDSARWASKGSFEQYINHGDGTYTFTREGVVAESGLTQRFNIISQEGPFNGRKTLAPHQEISLDFSADGGEALYTKSVVAQESCEQCHDATKPIARRHDQYFELETCVSCHSETNMQGERASFQHLVHAIHDSTHAFSDSKGNEYTGKAAEKLLQNNCESCHIASSELTQWGNWSQVPTKETCSACHNAGYGDNNEIIHVSHLAGQSDNASCGACHSQTDIEQNHVADFRLANQAADSLRSELTLTAATDGMVSVKLQLLDKQGNKVSAADYIDSLDFVEIIGNVNPQATQLDYSAKAKLSVRGTGDKKIADYISQDGTITTQFKLLSAPFSDATALVIAGVRLCSANGEFVACGQHDRYIAIDSAASTVAMAGVELTLRHNDSVENSRCAACHSDNFQIHNSFVENSSAAGFTLNDNMHVGDCAACHTPHGTWANGVNQGAIEMKLHSKHQSQQIVSDCSQCHINFNIAAFENKPALATEKGLYSSPWAATCGSCHDFDTPMTQGTLAEHMVDFGNAVINMPIESAVSMESCGMCHIPSLSDHSARKF